MSEVTHRCEPHRKAADIGFRLCGIVSRSTEFVTKKCSTKIDRETIWRKPPDPIGRTAFVERIQFRRQFPRQLKAADETVDGCFFNDVVFCVNDTQHQLSFRFAQPLDKLTMCIFGLLTGIGYGQGSIESVIERFCVSFMCLASCQQDTILPDLKQQLADAAGIFMGKERKAFSEQIAQTEAEISRRLDALPAVVQAEGYPDVQSFTATYRKAEAVVGQ